MFGQVHAQGGEVGFPESGLLRIKTFEQSLHLPRLLGSRDKGIEMFVKSHQPRFIIFTYSHIRKNK